MTRFRIHIAKIRPSGHELTAYKGEFGCKNSSHHLKDILAFLEQLETVCPVCMDLPKQLYLNKVPGGQQMRKSKKLGRLKGWGNYVVYEALVLLICAFCGAKIHPGDLFTRKMGIGYGNTTINCCRGCME